LLATGHSFYGQVLPSNSVNFGFAQHSVHWLSKVPGKLTGTWTADLASNPEEISIWNKQADEDWNRFIQYRAKELCLGGKLIVVCGAQIGTDSTFSSCFKSFNKVLRDMLADGLLPEVEDISIPVLYRTKEQLQLPFGTHTDLKIEKMELVETEDPYYVQYKKDGNASAFAKGIRDLMQNVLDEQIFAIINKKRHDLASSKKTVEILFNRWEEHCKLHPSECNMSSFLWTLLITKHK